MIHKAVTSSCVNPHLITRLLATKTEKSNVVAIAREVLGNLHNEAGLIMSRNHTRQLWTMKWTVSLSWYRCLGSALSLLLEAELFWYNVYPVYTGEKSIYDIKETAQAKKKLSCP